MPASVDLAPVKALRMALICPPLYSHLRAFSALAKALQRRGHTPIFLAFDFAQLPSEYMALRLPSASAAQMPTGLMQQIKHGARQTEQLCRLGLPLLQQQSIDLVLGDQMEPAAGLIAASLDLPLVSVACALPMDAEDAIPLPFLGWPHDPSPAGIKRNRGGARVADVLMGPQRRVIQRISKEWGLAPTRGRLQDCLSGQITLAQMLPGFDYPRTQSGAHIVELGTFAPLTGNDFPADVQLEPNKPLVYVSLGTILGNRVGLLRRIALACKDAGAQVLVSHGGCLDAKEAASIDAHWVRDFVPQQAVLGRADLCVTHAGLNTVLECLHAGVPMLALPLAFDQPGVAARVQHHGVGLRLGKMQRSRARIRDAVLRLLTQPQYKRAMRKFESARPAMDGAQQAVEYIVRAAL